MKYAHLVGFAALFLSGCASEGPSGKDAPLNSCTSDADCPSGVCASDGSENLCVATHADLQYLFLELDVPNHAPVAPGLHSVREASTFGLNLQGDSSEGFVRNVNLLTDSLFNVSATLQVKDLAPSCMALREDNSIRTTIELYPVNQPIGVSLAPYTGQYAKNWGGPKVLVPTGTYDVYLKPDLAAAPECTLPPVLIKEQTITQNTELVFTRTKPATLVGHLDVPHPVGCASDPLQCWQFDVLDNQRGRVLGGRQRVEAEGPKGTERFALDVWLPEKIPMATIDRVLVVHPPAALRQKGMPDLFWKVNAIDPDGNLDVSLQVASLVDATSRFIALEANVQTPEDEPVSANVLISGRQLLGGVFGANAVFQVASASDADGKFAANLLPGKYDIVVIPDASSKYALSLETWTIDVNDLGKGRTLKVKPVSRLLGQARTPSEGVAVGIPARLTASSSEEMSLLEAAFSSGASSLLASLPRTSTAYTDSLGVFELLADPGRLDLSLRPPSTTNFPWLVRRNIAIDASQPQALEFGALTLAAPVVLVGTLLTPEGPPLAGATLRAWLAPAPSTSEMRPSAIVIGEAATDDAGNYRLLLPPSASE